MSVVGYVVHTYPAVSHAFIQREVEGLREAGVQVHTLSVHQARGEHVQSDADRREAAATESILPVAPLRLAYAHLRALRHPMAYWKTLYFALGQAPLGRRRLWQLFYFAEAMAVWDWARRRHIDHLHAHLANVATDDVWLASVFDRLARPGGTWTWSFTMHGPTEFFAVERFNLARKVSAADAVICISDFCRSQLMLLCPASEWEKLVVVRCGADLDRYDYRPALPSSAAEPGSEGRTAVICVGRLVGRKGQVVLLEALPRLPGVSVTFVGSGPAAAELEAQATRLGVDGRVTFAGPRGQDEIPQLMADHDVFCLPSFAEGVPVVLMEAMAVGLPVVATTIAGVPELVADGVNGLLVPPGRADLLADAVARLVADAGLRQRLGQAGRRTVEAAYDSRANASELAVIFSGMPRPHQGIPTGCPSAEQDLLHDL